VTDHSVTVHSVTDDLATDHPTPPYDRAAIFNEHGPFNPSFMREAIRTLMRSMPLDPAEPHGWQDRRMHAALLALAALNPRDEIEVMLGVQAISAYHAAAACWRIGMNHHRPNGDSTRHITAAGSAARTFDAMLKAIERRQARPLTVPVGRPACHVCRDPHPSTVMRDLVADCRCDQDRPETVATPESVAIIGSGVTWSAQDLAFADAFLDRERIARENQGLDIANTEGILPGGGMILPEHPTPQQEAYIARRLGLMYRREHAENVRNGITTVPEIRGIRPGDLIP
jgi:hypothetical protein